MHAVLKDDQSLPKGSIKISNATFKWGFKVKKEAEKSKVEPSNEISLHEIDFDVKPGT